MSDIRDVRVVYILPVFSGQHRITPTLKSLVSQDVDYWHCIVVDDGSKDATAKKVQDFIDRYPNHFTLVKNDQNCGVAKSLNRGIDECQTLFPRAQFYARIDAGDRCYSYRTRVQYEAMRDDPDLAVLGMNVRVCVPRGRGYEVTISNSPSSFEEVLTSMCFSNPIAHPSVMMRADIANKFRYREDALGTEDFDLWTRIAVSGVGRVENLADVGVDYVISQNSETHRHVGTPQWERVWVDIVTRMFSYFGIDDINPKRLVYYLNGLDTSITNQAYAQYCYQRLIEQDASYGVVPQIAYRRFYHV